MNTKQSQEVVNSLFGRFSDWYVESHPGCNGNDVERAFLNAVGYGVSMVTKMDVDFTPAENAKIESIR